MPSTRWFLDVESERRPAVSREIDRERLVVGRGAECDVEIPDQRVSRQHCRFELRGDELWVEDLGSRAGTRLNGRRLEGAARLMDHDRLELPDGSRLLVRQGPGGARVESSGSSSATRFRDAASMLVGRADLAAASSAGELRKLAERVQLINEVHLALAESPSRDALLEMILDRVFAVLAPEEAAVLLLDRDGQLTTAVSRPPGLGADRVFVSRSLLREVTERRCAALVLDASADERFAGAASVLDAGVRSVLAAPLLVPNGALGMIVLSSRIRVRQFDEDDMPLLVSLASVAALHLRNLGLAAEAEERRRLAAELELARRIQVALLPAHLPEVAGYEILAGNIPSRGVSGDLYTVEIHPETGIVTFLVCDVSGKGMAASLLGASLEALAVGPIEVGFAPDAICQRVSRRLFARTPPEKYATGFVAQLDPRAHRLEWTNAGHNSALLVRPTGEVEHLAASGPPLGLMAGASYRAHSAEMAPGDLLLVYTDGITEAADPDEEEFGLERLAEVVQRHRAASLVELRRAVESALDQFVRGEPFADDRTLVFLRRLDA